MKLAVNLFIKQFLRTFSRLFTAKDFSSMLSRIGMKLSISECKEFLDENENVFALADGFYATRTCAFSNRFFSFKPTRCEINNGVFIPGHRCMPFVDPEMFPCDLKFVYNGIILPKKVIDFDSDAAIDLFLLYGEEFAVQYIASDPANEDINLVETEFLLPSTVKMTGFSIEPIIQTQGFNSGDRILCRVIDWDYGIVEVSVIHHKEQLFELDEHDLNREKWYSQLEDALIRSFKLIGPCSSIEEQLALVFAEYREQLCIRDCGAVEELLAHSKKISLEFFGVETRIWYKNQEVPAIGEWNKEEIDNVSNEIKRSNITIFEQVPQFIEDAFLKDLLFSKKEDFDNILNAMYPAFYLFDKNLKNDMLLHLKSRRDILRKNYNRFVDYEISGVRKDALNLYKIVNELVCTIDMSGSNLAKYPQQPLVILSQIYGHVVHIIDMMENIPSEVIREIDEVSMSLEGMEFNFEEICEQLRQAIDKEKQNIFSVVGSN